MQDEIIKDDFLLWQNPDYQHGCVVVGNPPFGLRGHLALQFVNHTAKFADMIGFIVPQLFNSDGKGVLGKRVAKNMVLAHSEDLPSNSFETPNGDDLDVSTLFQVWTSVNKDKVQTPDRKCCKRWISVYFLSNGGTPSSTRNKAIIGKCDLYLPSTCFNGMKAYNHFEDLPHRRSYGVIIHKDKSNIMRLLQSHDWNTSAFRSTNGVVNLRRSLIENVLIKASCHD